jgi:pyrimidine operon attenuation protein/uracil phosphoribosyltransferase
LRRTRVLLEITEIELEILRRAKERAGASIRGQKTRGIRCAEALSDIRALGYRLIKKTELDELKEKAWKYEELCK